MTARLGGGAGAAGAVAAGVVALWLAFGVSAEQVVRYLGYEVAFVVLPGVVALRAIAPGIRGALTTLAVGLGLGYALELAAFALTGVLDVRGAFPLHPLAVVAVAGPVAWRRRRGRAGRERLPRAAAWVVAAAVVLAAVYIAGGYFTMSPEPGGAEPLAYYPDFAFHLSLAAEAKHHWPLEDPSVAGRDLRYHTFVHMHMAAASDVAGIELTPILFRLLPLTLVVVTAIQMAALGRRFAGAAGAAIAVVLALCAGELDLDPERFAPFAGNLLRGLFLSPSMLFGLVFLLPAALLAVDRLRGGGGRGELVVLTLVLAAAAGAKAALLPLLLASLALLGVWIAIAERRLDRVVTLLFGITAGVFLATYALLYSGGGEGGLEPGLLAMFDATVIAETLRRPSDGAGGAVLWLFAAPVTLVLLCLPLVGAGWAVVRHGRRMGAARAFLVALFVTGLAFALVLRHPAGAQLYFLYYGYLAVLPLAAEGFVMIWRSVAAHLGRPARDLAAAAAAVLAVGLAASELVRALDLRTSTAYALMYGALALSIALAAAGLRQRARPLSGQWIAGVVAGLLVIATALDAPIDWVREPAGRLADGRSVYTADARPGLHALDRSLLEGLRWIRANTDEDAVLAVNNHWADTARTHPLFDYYSAFAERRVYLQSWLYSQASLEMGYARVKRGALPFPERLALNDGAFRHPALIPRLRAAGVTHMVVDRLNGRAAPATAALGEAAYANGSIAVYELG